MQANVVVLADYIVVCEDDSHGTATISVEGIMCSGIAYYIQGTVMKERGPVFMTAFNPLCMIIVAIMGSIILAEEITLGSYWSLLSDMGYEQGSLDPILR
uniref:WAT1-related protein At2g39510 isoform X5 n=1 Tax=Elaeis guineensis var. tenera TaxID=51953 RepID=A0A6I9RHT9_ELAGV|nr:WAT1-related protein At2g39510 isoform X5 [Elaeis guineensis]